MSQAVSPGAAQAAEERLRLRIKLRADLRGIVCSGAWENDCVAQALAGRVEFKGRRSQQERELFRKRFYPPGGADTMMVRCARCQEWHPPQSIDAGKCGPCVEEIKEKRLERQRRRSVSGTTHSPSAAARQFIEEEGLQVVESKLPEETLAALEAEINRYHDGDWQEIRFLT